MMTVFRFIDTLRNSVVVGDFLAELAKFGHSGPDCSRPDPSKQKGAFSAMLQAGNVGLALELQKRHWRLMQCFWTPQTGQIRTIEKLAGAVTR